MHMDVTVEIYTHICRETKICIWREANAHEVELTDFDCGVD